MKTKRHLLMGAILLLFAARASWAQTRPDHIVLVMEENHSFNEIIGSKSAPYINRVLVSDGALMTQSFAITHPSEPNYCALFCGSTMGVNGDPCNEDFPESPNLAKSLLNAGFTFTGYSEGLSKAGSEECRSSDYARKHCPWVNWQENGNFPGADSQPFKAFPKGPDYSGLPTVCWVIPNLINDMHDGSIEDGDEWLQKKLGGYITWCQAHNSLLILTWDEDDSQSSANQIVTVFYGAGVKAGKYDEVINHYSVLRTIMDMFHLVPINYAAKVTPIRDIFETKATAKP